MRFLNIKENDSTLGVSLTYCIRNQKKMPKSMRIRIKNRLLSESGTKNLKRLLDRVQSKKFQQYLDRRVISV